jgi:hypothetical protein
MPHFKNMVIITFTAEQRLHFWDLKETFCQEDQGHSVRKETSCLIGSPIQVGVYMVALHLTVVE